MNPAIEQKLLRQLNGQDWHRENVVQSLWSGYGEIVRYSVKGREPFTVVVKAVEAGAMSESAHPRGWGTELGHQRKLRSYQIEKHFYQAFSDGLPIEARIPTLLATATDTGGFYLVLEDLDAAGFGRRLEAVSESELLACLRWLAAFHAHYLGVEPQGLWPVGTYWHLETRPDEWQAMQEGPLKEAASAIDRRLNQARHQTLVHGDAKLANFCFADERPVSAAVDFQYVGGGTGIKDVAYFFSSCLSEKKCHEQGEELLAYYFESLREGLSRVGKAELHDSVEAEWRALYPLAWADFYRFLAGWLPDHWKINGYGQRLVEQGLACL